MDDEDDEPVDALMEEFDTYEDYLDKQITPTDLYYLEDVELARQLVELGYRGNGELLRRDEFDVRKEAHEIAKKQRANKRPKKLASAGKDLEGYPLLTVRRVNDRASIFLIVRVRFTRRRP
jgi:hypothetical protein